LKWNGIDPPVPARGGASKVLECGLYIFDRIEIGKVNETLQCFWSHLQDSVKGFRPAFAEAATRRQV